MLRPTARRTTLCAFAALACAVGALAGAQAGQAAGQAAGRLPTLPDAPQAMVTTQRLLNAATPDLTGGGATGGGTGGAAPGDPLAAAAQAQASPQALSGAMRSCALMSVASSVSGSGASTRVVIKGSTVSFGIGQVPASWWKSPPVSGVTWQLYFRGLIWVGRIAQGALERNDAAAIDALVRTAAGSVASNPDPGRAVDGWDEGTNLRRQESLNCLYRASNGDPRLIPAITATAKANLDMSRYYGPPNYPPHNHGLMANLALLDAADLLHNATWKSVAVNRMVNDSRGAFTAGGVSVEQSGYYHVFNVTVWTDAADLLASYPDRSISAAAPAIRADVARARAATAFMTDPLGHLVAWGDGSQKTIGVDPQPALLFRDDAAGLVTGRWSWTDSRTSYYLFRYGRGCYGYGHCHDDRGELVWTTLGLPVLIDPGIFTYDAGSFNAFQQTPIGHNVQMVDRRSPNQAMPVVLRTTKTTGLVHCYTTTDIVYGVSHTRTWRIDQGVHSVLTTDTVAAPATTTMHFDAGWAYASRSADGKTLTLTHPSGHVATVRSSTAMRIYQRSATPVLGWQFPHYSQRIADVQVLMDAPAGTSTMSVTVS